MTDSRTRQKLTTNQRATLEAIARGEVYNLHLGIAAWRIQGASPPVVGRLIRTLMLAEWGPMQTDREPCVLTPAGRRALEQSHD